MLDEGCTVLEHARVIALGTTFIRAAGRWPDLMTSALGRMRRQHMRLTTQSLIVLLPRAEHRLLLMVAHLSDRWGRVTPEGVHVPLRLTHQTLARIIGAQRPSVTTSLKGLAERGALSRRRDGTWVLHGDPPDCAGSPDSRHSLREPRRQRHDRQRGVGAALSRHHAAVGDEQVGHTPHAVV